MPLLFTAHIIQPCQEINIISFQKQDYIRPMKSMGYAEDTDTPPMIPQLDISFVSNKGRQGYRLRDVGILLTKTVLLTVQGFPKNQNNQFH